MKMAIFLPARKESVTPEVDNSCDFHENRETNITFNFLVKLETTTMKPQLAVSKWHDGKQTYEPI